MLKPLVFMYNLPPVSESIAIHYFISIGPYFLLRHGFDGETAFIQHFYLLCCHFLPKLLYLHLHHPLLYLCDWVISESIMHGIVGIRCSNAHARRRCWAFIIKLRLILVALQLRGSSRHGFSIISYCIICDIISYEWVLSDIGEGYFAQAFTQRFTDGALTMEADFVWVQDGVFFQEGILLLFLFGARTRHWRLRETS